MILNESLFEDYHVNDELELYCAGYILPDGSFAMLNDVPFGNSGDMRLGQHGDDEELDKPENIEFSHSHPEDDTCVRLRSIPTAAQYKSLEIVIDKYLDKEHYCKVEFLKPLKHKYVIFSDDDLEWSNYSYGYETGAEKVYEGSEWNGYTVVRWIKQNISKQKLAEATSIISYKPVFNIDKFKKYADEILGSYGGMSDSDIKRDIEEIYIDGELKGYIGLSKYNEEDGTKLLGIGNFMIIERGKGYGTQVIKDIVSKYKNEYDLIYCFVDSDNEGAISLYKKLGKVYDEDGPNDNDQYYVTFYDNGKYKLEESLSESLQMDNLKLIAQDIYDAFEEHDIDGNNQNCMLCTWATELQLRGQDILPRPVYSPRDIIFSGEFKGEDIVVNPQKISIKDKEDVIDKVQSAGNGSRFYCHVNWNDSNGGHEFLLVNMGGEIYIVDSQSNYIELIEEDDNYFNDINFKNSYIVRLDDKDINQKVLKYNDFDYVVEWDEDIDSKMLEEDLNPNSIIAYHGSNAKFNKFDLKYFGRTDDGMWGKGIYFTNDKNIAMCFGLNLYKCRLTLTNPYIIDNKGTKSGDMSDGAIKYLELTDKNNDVLQSMGYDGIISLNEEWEWVGNDTTEDQDRIDTIIANQYIVFNPDNIEILDVKDLSLEESYNSNKNINDIETPEQLMDWMEENITYELANDEYGVEDDPPTKTAEEVIETGTGHCAEQSYLEKQVLDELGYDTQLIFIKENNSEDDYGADGSAHMFLVITDEDNYKYIYFEHSQEHNKGIHTFDTLDKLFDFVGKNWWRYDENSDVLEFRRIDEPITGVDNWELAQECHKAPMIYEYDISNNIMEDDVPLDAEWDFEKSMIVEESLTEARKKRKVSKTKAGDPIFKSVNDMKKWVKKRQKGLSPFCYLNPNAGNVPLNNSIFNSMFSSDGSSGVGTSEGGVSNGGLSVGGGDAGGGMGESFNPDLKLKLHYTKSLNDYLTSAEQEFIRNNMDLINSDSWLELRDEADNTFDYSESTTAIFKFLADGLGYDFTYFEELLNLK